MSAAMSARTALAARSAWTALAGFLRGFVGIAAFPPRRAATPSAARDSLAAQASQRGRCC